MSWVKEYKARVLELAGYATELESRLDYALQELSELSQGVGIKPLWHDSTSPWSLAMQHKAALAVKKVSEMPLRRRVNP